MDITTIEAEILDAMPTDCRFRLRADRAPSSLRRNLPGHLIELVRRLGVLSAVIVLAGCSADAQIRPFTTDGCSEFPDGTPRHRKIWRDCCVLHDRAYWRGGPYKERLEADRALQTCVQAVGEPAVATLMLAGVRVRGSPWWPTPISLGIWLTMAARLRRADGAGA